ncbi:CHRD domain-containing protein [Persicobacter diffluens]|uniref:CHRD domain-containing protein n=1 Tax=Persicobacter diffluens TaxID=981 RepID=A0AAN4VW60_9BACT|nr:hypothetical protein PEDI_17660 [Persicobacter diffluens]
MDKLKTSRLLNFLMLVLFSTWMISCSDDDNGGDPGTPPVAPSDSITYQLMGIADPSVTGTATFIKVDDATTTVRIELENAPTETDHPTHIHFNTAAEGGDIAISLDPVDATSGRSETVVTATDAGDAISYDALANFDGYINVHLSADDLATIVAQGDIGMNVLTGESVIYNLSEVDVEGISGDATFYERKGGHSLVVISLEGTPAGGEHPAHIHLNTAAEGGGIYFTFNPVNGDTGSSQTTIRASDAEESISYEELLDFDGYINVHLSAEALETIVAQGDIGQNALTGESVEYTLNSVAVESISGTAIFSERENGLTLVQIQLEGTPEGGEHPAHIHFNTAAEGGDIAISLTSVNGDTGYSRTTIRTNDAEEEITYADLLEYNGYINVHLSAEALETIVAQGDIGQNALTGEETVYMLSEVDVAGISGMATFSERMNGTTLINVELEGTTDGASHPMHIHFNSAAEGGGIAITLNNVDGGTGTSLTQVSQQDDESAITYEELIAFDGYINVHQSATDLGTLVGQGNIGSNVTAP